MYCGETYLEEEEEEEEAVVVGDARDEEGGGVCGEAWYLSREVFSGDRGTTLRAILHEPATNYVKTTLAKMPDLLLQEQLFK